MDWKRIIRGWWTPAAGTVFGAPGMFDDFAFWQHLVGDMSAGWVGASAGIGIVLFIVWGGFVVERHWAVIRENANWIAKAIVSIAFMLTAVGFLAYLIFIKESTETAWIHPTLTVVEQEQVKAECRMRAIEFVGGSGRWSFVEARNRYVTNCKIARGFREVEISND